MLLHMCGSSSICASDAAAAEVVAGAAALCVDLLLLLAEDGMQQQDLDTLAEKLAVKVAVSLAGDQVPDMQQQQQQQVGPANSREEGTTAAAAAVLQQWAARVDSIISQPADKVQQPLQGPDRLAHLQMLLSLP